MSHHKADLEPVRRIKGYLRAVRIATALFPDERRRPAEVGLDTARNLYEQAGQGLADDACDLLDVMDRG